MTVKHGKLGISSAQSSMRTVSCSISRIRRLLNILAIMSYTKRKIKLIGNVPTIFSNILIGSEPEVRQFEANGMTAFWEKNLCSQLKFFPDDWSIWSFIFNDHPGVSNGPTDLEILQYFEVLFNKWCWKVWRSWSWIKNTNPQCLVPGLKV